MSLLGMGSNYEQLIDKATSEYNTEDDWGTIMELCDGIKNYNGAKECASLLRRQFHIRIPNVTMQTLTVIDACINNCGQSFKLEVATKDYTKELKYLVKKGHPKVAEKTKELIKKWAQDFKEDPSLFLLPMLYNELLREGATFPSPKMVKKSLHTNNPDFVETKEEEDDIAKAIHLSLKEAKMTPYNQTSKSVPSSQPTSTNATTTPLYPNTKNPGPGTVRSSKKALALYDFEAVEDNELSFHANDTVMVVDDSDQNWWRGYLESNSSHEGLFPATFVTFDLNPSSSGTAKKGVSFATNPTNSYNTYQSSEDSESITSSAYATIDENVIDRCLKMLNAADPTGKIPDPEDLPIIEHRALSTSNLIDQELEKVDDCHSELFELNRKLNEALRFYNYLVTTTVMGNRGCHLPPTGYSAPANNSYNMATAQPIALDAGGNPFDNRYFRNQQQQQQQQPISSAPITGSYPPSYPYNNATLSNITLCAQNPDVGSFEPGNYYPPQSSREPLPTHYFQQPQRDYMTQPAPTHYNNLTNQIVSEAATLQQPYAHPQGYPPAAISQTNQMAQPCQNLAYEPFTQGPANAFHQPPNVQIQPSFDHAGKLRNDSGNQEPGMVGFNAAQNFYQPQQQQQFQRLNNVDMNPGIQYPVQPMMQPQLPNQHST